MFKIIPKLLIGLLIVKFTIIWIGIPFIVGMGIRKVDQCPEVNFDELIKNNYDKKIDEIKLDIDDNEFKPIISGYIEYKRWLGHQQFGVFKKVYEQTSRCDLS